MPVSPSAGAKKRRSLAAHRSRSGGYERRRRGSQVSPRTLARRVNHGCTSDEVQQMKDLFDYDHLTFEEIAQAMGKPPEAVQLALMNTRSWNSENPRAVINTNRATQVRFFRRARPDESGHDALERLLDEADQAERLIRPLRERALPGETPQATLARALRTLDRAAG